MKTGKPIGKAFNKINDDNDDDDDEEKMLIYKMRKKT